MLVAILIGTLAISLQAETESAVTADIPFPFTVGTQTIAPGTYVFRLVSGSFLLSVRNVKSGHPEMFGVRPEQEFAAKPHGRLVFLKCGDADVLNEVHFREADIFIEVRQPHCDARIETKRVTPSAPIAVAQR
jgi:hypothetical protein